MKNKYFLVTKKELKSIKNKEGVSLERLLKIGYLHTFSSRYTINITCISNAKVLKRRSYDKKRWVYCFVRPGVNYEVKKLYTKYSNVVSRIRNQINTAKKWNTQVIKKFERKNRSLDFALFKLRN